MLNIETRYDEYPGQPAHIAVDVAVTDLSEDGRACRYGNSVTAGFNIRFDNKNPTRSINTIARKIRALYPKAAKANAQKIADWKRDEAREKAEYNAVLLLQRIAGMRDYTTRGMRLAAELDTCREGAGI